MNEGYDCIFGHRVKRGVEFFEGSHRFLPYSLRNTTLSNAMPNIFK